MPRSSQRSPIWSAVHNPRQPVLSGICCRLRKTAIALANSPAMLAGDQRESYEFAQRVMAASHSNSYATLIASDSRMVFTTRRPFGEELPKVGDRAGFTAAMAARAPRTSDLFQGTVAKSPLAAVWAPTVRGDEIVALTTVTIEPPELTSLLRDEHLPDGWIATIVDRRGTIVARSAAPEKWIGTEESAEAWAAGARAARGTYSLVNEDGVRVLSYFITLPSAGWQVIVAVPKEQFDAPIDAAWRFMAALRFLALAIATGLALLVGRHMSRHIISVADDAVAICAGRSPKTGRSGIRELDSTSAALLGATQRLVSSEQKLRASERRLDAILNSLPIGVALVDLHGEPIIANKMFTMFVPKVASSRDGVRYALWEGFEPNAQRPGGADNPAERALRGERVWPGEEFLFRGDKSRDPFWTRVAALPYQDENLQIIGATAVIVDIDTQSAAFVEVFCQCRRGGLPPSNVGRWCCSPAAAVASTRRCSSTFMALSAKCWPGSQTCGSRARGGDGGREGGGAAAGRRGDR